MPGDKEYLPRRVLSVQAHPDDQEFTVAGTLARWTRTGCRVIAVTVTSGESGSNDPAHGAAYKPDLASIREAEQASANRVLGIAESVFLRYPDGELEPNLALRKDLARLIRTHKPDTVVIGDPQAVFYGNGYINHPDHRAAAQAALYAVFPSAGTRLIFTDLLEAGYEPHNVKRLYIHGTERPDTAVDIAATLEVKIAALKKHTSQLSGLDVEKLIRTWAQEEGKPYGLEYAEAFKVMLLQEEEDQG